MAVLVPVLAPKVYGKPTIMDKRGPFKSKFLIKSRFFLQVDFFLPVDIFQIKSIFFFSFMSRFFN